MKEAPGGQLECVGKGRCAPDNGRGHVGTARGQGFSTGAGPDGSVGRGCTWCG